MAQSELSHSSSVSVETSRQQIIPDGCSRAGTDAPPPLAPPSPHSCGSCCVCDAARQMLHLWLHLKSDNWVRWRETQDRRGAVDPSTAAAAAAASPDAARSSSAAAGGGGGGENRDVASAAAVTRGLGNNAPGAPLPRRVGGGGARTPARRASSVTRGGTRSRGSSGAAGSKSGKNSGVSSKQKAGFSTGEKGAGSEGEGGEGPAAGGASVATRTKRVRYRLDGEHDRVLANWEEPARKALQVRLV